MVAARGRNLLRTGFSPRGRMLIALAEQFCFRPYIVHHRNQQHEKNGHDEGIEGLDAL